MRNKLSIIFLLLGGVFFMVGATFMSLNSEKHEEKKEVPDDTERKIETYMPVIYKIEDNDSFVYIVPDLPLGESRITDIDKRIYDLIDKYRLVVQYNNTKLDQLDYIKNFVLNDEDYLDNYLNDIVRTKLFDFSNAHSKYNYDDYMHYTIGFNYSVLENLAYYEAGLTTDSFLSDLINEYDNKEGSSIIALETSDEIAKYINTPSKETYSKLIENMIDNFDTVKKDYKENYKNYINGNTKGLDDYYNKMDTTSEYYNVLVLNRNNKFMTFIEKYLKTNESAVLVIDAQHVYGDNGLIKLLEAKDYAIRTIK